MAQGVNLSPRYPLTLDLTSLGCESHSRGESGVLLPRTPCALSPCPTFSVSLLADRLESTLNLVSSKELLVIRGTGCRPDINGKIEDSKDDDPSQQSLY